MHKTCQTGNLHLIDIWIPDTRLIRRTMAHVSARSLILLSALFWYGGGFVLLIKGVGLAMDARRLVPGNFWPGVILVSGAIIGTVKARYLFSISCRKNLSRINALTQPRWWQFFRPGFFLFLALMICAGVILSRLSQGNYGFLLVVALLDLSVAVGLIGSSYVFWGNFHDDSPTTRTKS